MENNVKAMSEEEIRELGNSYCQKNGYELLEMKKLDHPADFYLRYVLAYSEASRQYATWLFNVEMGGLHHGHYYDHYYTGTQEECYGRAYNDFLER